MNYITSKYELAKHGKPLDIIKLFALVIVAAVVSGFVEVEVVYCA